MFKYYSFIFQLELHFVCKYEHEQDTIQPNLSQLYKLFATVLNLKY